MNMRTIHTPSQASEHFVRLGPVVLFLHLHSTIPTRIFGGGWIGIANNTVQWCSFGISSSGSISSQHKDRCKIQVLSSGFFTPPLCTEYARSDSPTRKGGIHPNQCTSLGPPPLRDPGRDVTLRPSKLVLVHVRNKGRNNFPGG